ncbi:MAG: Rne/Rng family ribonuclease [Alphaproteobacteria bacterium]|nr:Rne/Rng family ribonuclease [Alphaproteobacteria bacterium]
MIDELLATVAGGRHRIALRAEGRLVELFFAGDGAPDALGAIILGRVNAVLPGMEAAFVDIGADRAGFLSLAAPRMDAGEAEGLPGLPPVQEGSEVLVQVTKTAQEGKGAGLTRNVSLAGRYLVLTPTQPRIAISRRIEDEGDRQALADLMAAVARPGEGFILRTAARDAGADALAADAEELRDQWLTVDARRAEASPPQVLHGAARGLAEVLRDHAHDGMRRIVVDSRRAEAEAQAFCDAHIPDLGTRIELWDEPGPMFEALGVADDIAEALDPRVALPCGGSLIIEQTQALTAIDVNTGRNVGRSSHADTVRATNLEAAEEIPRQLRVRGLGGISVIDFIHMEDEADREAVLERLLHGFRADPAFIRATGISELGLVELARRRGDGTLAVRLADADD